jgi:uncharacterized protein HemY
VVVLALLILLVVAAVATAAIARGGGSATLDLQLFDVETNVTVVFLTGALCVLLGVLGAWMLLTGLKRGRRRRNELSRLRAQASARTTDMSTPAKSTPAKPEERRQDRRDDGSADDHFDSAPRDT